MPAGEKRCVAMFVRCPGKGGIKSRLSPVLDAEFSLLLYESLILDLLETLQGSGYPYRIVFTPADGGEEIIRRFGRCDAIPQIGADLGERMENAFRRCFAEGYTAVVIIGSDVPDLPPEILAEAFAALDARGAVIGPAVDGGYYLIGFTKETFVPGVFEGIPWSTDAVFPETLARLEEAAIGVHRLPTWRDMDTPEDLKELVRRNRDAPFSRSRTMSCLAAGGFSIVS
ncbi:MAG: TIGR04282 family arsenosugar biosynthesis glycosyltransferase [Syntrophales bacterium]